MVSGRSVALLLLITTRAGFAEPAPDPPRPAPPPPDAAASSSTPSPSSAESERPEVSPPSHEASPPAEPNEALPPPEPNEASPPPPRVQNLEEPRPFEQGSMTLGLALGFSSGSEGTAFTFGGAFGYFVLAGLEPGLDLEVTFGADRPTLTSVMPYLRWIIWRSYRFSPYLKVQGGRWFIADGQDDLTVVGGGGGGVIFVGRSAGINLEVMYYRLFPESVCGPDACSTVGLGLSLGFYFGGPDGG